MDWQLALTLIAITLAGAYVAWRGVRVWRTSQSGCTGGCGCARSKVDADSQLALIAPEKLVLRSSDPRRR